MNPSSSGHAIAEVHVLKALLADPTMAPQTKEGLVRDMMTKLESLAASNGFNSCCAMIELWPIASELYLHDICDGIELWIDANGSTELINYVRSIDERYWGEGDSALYWEEIIRASMKRNEAQKAAAPNRSAAPSLNSEIPLRGSEG